MPAASRVPTARPDTATIRSSPRKPARAAGESGATSPITGFRPGTPYMNRTQNATSAKAKLNPGPASSTAMRATAGRFWNARAASCGGTGPSRSSSILT